MDLDTVYKAAHVPEQGSIGHSKLDRDLQDCGGVGRLRVWFRYLGRRTLGRKEIFRSRVLGSRERKGRG